jgi:hypothetical protein
VCVAIHGLVPDTAGLTMWLGAIEAQKIHLRRATYEKVLQA